MEAVGGEGTVLKGCLGKAYLEKRKELYESLGADGSRQRAEQVQRPRGSIFKAQQIGQYP